MNRHARCIALLAIALAGPLFAADPAPLGRLFFTPEKRAELDRERSLGQRQTQQIESADVSLEGIVRRSSGRNTVWLTGRPHDMVHPRDGILVNVGPDATTARVRIGDDAPADLRVGESINRGTGERRSGLGNGQVSAQRAGRP